MTPAQSHQTHTQAHLCPVAGTTEEDPAARTPWLSAHIFVQKQLFFFFWQQNSRENNGAGAGPHGRLATAL
jgi:hypothetical protein